MNVFGVVAGFGLSNGFSKSPPHSSTRPGFLTYGNPEPIATELLHTKGLTALHKSFDCGIIIFGAWVWHPPLGFAINRV
jgi:hypothetical protein